MRTSSWKTIKDDNTIGTDWKDLRIVNLVVSQSYDDNVPVVDSDVNFVDGDWWRPVVTKFLCRIRHRNIASLTLFLCFPPTKTYFGGEAERYALIGWSNHSSCLMFDVRIFATKKTTHHNTVLPVTYTTKYNTSSLRLQSAFVIIIAERTLYVLE